MNHSYAFYLIEYARKHGGFTLHVYDERQVTRGTGGNMVGIPGHELRIDDEYTNEKLAQLLQVYVSINSRQWGVNYLGCWIDGGHVYFDVSQRVNDVNEAYRLCKERGELAWFDVDKQTNVFVADYEKRDEV